MATDHYAARIITSPPTLGGISISTSISISKDKVKLASLRQAIPVLGMAAEREFPKSS